MYWMVFPGAVPGPVDLGSGDLPALVALLTACVPGWLAARHALNKRRAERGAPRLRIVHGVAESTRHAA